MSLLIASLLSRAGTGGTGGTGGGGTVSTIPVSEWTLDETSGATFADTRPAAVPMTIVGAWQSLTTASMMVGSTGTSAYRGTGSVYATLPADDPDHALAEMTLSLYYQRNSATADHMLLSIGDGTAQGDLELLVRADGKLSFWHVDQNGVKRSAEGSAGITGTNFGVNIAHRVDVSFGQLGVKLYMDGVFLPASWITDDTLGWNNSRIKYIGIASDINTRYVSPSGNDAADGSTPSTAWQTIDKVNASIFQPGTQILFKGGQTFVGSLSFTATSWVGATSTNPITIGSYGAGRAMISSGAGFGITVLNNSGFELRDLIFVGNPSTTGEFTDGVYIVTDLPGTGKLDYVRVINLDISGYGRHGLNVMGGYGGPSSNSTAGFNDVTIDGVISHGNSLKHTGDNSASGINAHGFWGFNLDRTHPTHTNVTIRNCKAYDNLGVAGGTLGNGHGIIVGAGVQYGLVEFCEAYNNGTLSTSSAGPVGFMAYDADNIVFQYCESHHNHTSSGTDGIGFDLDGGVTNSTVRYCYSHDNDGPGLMMYNYSALGSSWDNNTIAYCISENDAPNRFGDADGSVMIASDGLTLTNIKFHNNTIFNSNGASTVIGLGKSSGNNMTGLVANNIFYSSAGAWMVNAYASNPINLLFRGNNYYAVGSFGIKWSSVVYSFSGWQTTVGQEKQGATLYGSTVNPLLTNPGFGGTLGGMTSLPPNLPAYKLLAGSPMINTGLNLLSMFSINPGAVDFYRTAVSTATLDVGAHEFV